MNGRGSFITLEGGEGTGKSTQVARLADALKGAGIEAVVTREPGGAEGAEEIRTLLVRGNVVRWEPMTEVLLHYAARSEHLQKTVLPALDRGQWVISDRFADSTMAYQGHGHGIDREVIEDLHRLVVGEFAPDLTVILDLDVVTGLERAKSVHPGEDRYERMDIEFHRRLRQGFLDIAEKEPDRCAVIDASGSVEEVNRALCDIVSRRLGVSL